MDTTPESPETQQGGDATEMKAPPRKKPLILIIAGIVVVVAGLLIYFLWRPDLSGEIVIPYLGHQRPLVDPQGLGGEFKVVDRDRLRGADHGRSGAGGGCSLTDDQCRSEGDTGNNPDVPPHRPCLRSCGR